MYNYLTVKTHDYSGILSISPNGDELIITPEKAQKVRFTDSGNEEAHSYSLKWFFLLNAPFEYLTEDDFETLLDFYHDPLKANGRERSFWFQHPTDNHYYVAYFENKFSWNEYRAKHFSLSGVLLKIIGYGTPS